jgi:hypothetical protein
MTAVSAAVPTEQFPAPPRLSAAGRALTFAAVLVAVGLSVLSGLGAGTGSKLAVVMPVAVAAGAVLGLLALTRFSVYVMVMLVLRASVDLAKLSGDAAPVATQAQTDVAARGLDPSSLVGVVFLLAGALWLAAQHYR